MLLLSSPGPVAQVRQCRRLSICDWGPRPVGVIAVLEHPGVLRAPSAGGVDDQGAILEGHPSEAPRNDVDALPEDGEGAQVDMPRGERPIGPHRGHGRETHHVLGDPPFRVGRDHLAHVDDFCLIGMGADHHPATPRLPGGLHHQLVDALEHMLQYLRI